MQITKKFLEKECEKMASLLSSVEVKAEIVRNDDDIYIALTDLQGAPLNDVEVTHFHYAAEVLESLNVYFEGIYLNGDICCDAGHDFQDFKEAEEYARKSGYTAEADNIKTLLDILEEEPRIVFSDDYIGYILPRREIEAAHRHMEYLSKMERMKAALYRLIYGGFLIEDSYYADIFEDKYGISVEEALGLADRATDNFFTHYTVDEPEREQMDFWAAETVKQYAEEAAQKREHSSYISCYIVKDCRGCYKHLRLKEALEQYNKLQRKEGNVTLNAVFDNGDELCLIHDGKITENFMENARKYACVYGLKEIVQEIFWFVIMDGEVNNVALGA